MMWILDYSGLSDSELAAIESLFRSVEGRRGTFVFLDPSANLLLWSEDLLESTWTRDPLLTVSQTADVAGLNAAAFSLMNAGQTEQAIAQVVGAPGGLQYSFSFYARANSACALVARNGASARTFEIGGAWQRFCFSHVGTAGGEIFFSLAIVPGAAVEVCGLQVEAQPTASAYKPTWSEGGVHANARFADDELRITTYGANNHSVVVRITAATRRS
jgi:hypothetical protein